jgi:hypothetical protein
MSTSTHGIKQEPTEAAQRADFDLLEEHLARDVKSSLAMGLRAKAVFEKPGPPRAQFQGAVAQAITAIQSKDRGELLRRFLDPGPYAEEKQIKEYKGKKWMTDAEVAAAIRFIFASAINAFQGQLAEMLAIRAVLESRNVIAGLDSAVLHIGDAVKAPKHGSDDWAKAADFHWLSRTGGGAKALAEVRGLVEVKSFSAVEEKLLHQLNGHAARARRGLRLGVEEVAGKRIKLGEPRRRTVKIAVVPDTWPLPRRYTFETRGDRTFLVVEPPRPPAHQDRVERISEDFWKITLRWSEEALAAAAYGLTYWYMGELGRLIYGKGVPPEWSEMTPEEAGQNAVVQSLYYAMLRARTVRESSRAIALYNSYGFGYALGANFVDRHGRRQELFYEDLKEILETGRSRTKPLDKKHSAQRCRIRGLESPGGDLR